MFDARGNAGITGTMNSWYLSIVILIASRSGNITIARTRNERNMITIIIDIIIDIGIGIDIGIVGIIIASRKGL